LQCSNAPKKSHDYLCSHKFTFNIRSGAGDEVAVKRPLGGDDDELLRKPDLSFNFTCSFSNPHLFVHFTHFLHLASSSLKQGFCAQFNCRPSLLGGLSVLSLFTDLAAPTTQ